MSADKERSIEEYLILNGPATANELADAVGLSQPTVSRLLQSLTTGGQVQAFAFDQKLYSAKRKPTSLKALLRVQLCAIARMAAVYDSSTRKLGQIETDTKLIEALRHEMTRWSDVINSIEDKHNEI